MKEELQEKRKINIIHGKVMSDYVIVGKPKKGNFVLQFGRSFVLLLCFYASFLMHLS